MYGVMIACAPTATRSPRARSSLPPLRYCTPTTRAGLDLDPLHLRLQEKGDARVLVQLRHVKVDLELRAHRTDGAHARAAADRAPGLDAARARARQGDVLAGVLARQRFVERVQAMRGEGVGRGARVRPGLAAGDPHCPFDPQEVRLERVVVQRPVDADAIQALGAEVVGMHPRRVARPARAAAERDVLDPGLLRGAVDDHVVEAEIEVAPALEARRRVGAAAPLEHEDASVRAGVAQVLEQEERRGEAGADDDRRIARRGGSRRHVVRFGWICRAWRMPGAGVRLPCEICRRPAT